MEEDIKNSHDGWKLSKSVLFTKRRDWSVHRLFETVKCQVNSNERRNFFTALISLHFVNWPRSIYQYSNMAPRLSGQTPIFGVVFIVSKSLLRIEGQKKLKKIAILTRKPRSHAWMLIYRTWPIEPLNTAGGGRVKGVTYLWWTSIPSELGEKIHLVA